MELQGLKEVPPKVIVPVHAPLEKLEDH